MDSLQKIIGQREKTNGYNNCSRKSIKQIDKCIS